MYLTASRPDITFAGHPNLGLWYPRDSPFDLEAFSDSDYAGAAGDGKSITAKYVAAASCCCQYGFVPADTMTRVTWNSFLLIELIATIDGHEHTISEATIRTALHLDDLDVADVLPNQEIFDGLQAIRYRPDGPWGFLYSVWKPISICLSMLVHRFVKLALNITPTDTTEYVVPSFTSKVAQTNPLEGPPIAPQADEPMPDPAHALNVEEPIPSPVLEPVVQPVQTPLPIGSPSYLDIPSFGTTSTPQNIASTFDPLLSKAQFDAFTNFKAQQHHDQATSGTPIYEHPPIPNPTTPSVSTTEGAAEVPFTTDQMLALFLMCLQKIDALEKDLKATKRLNRDTMLLFYKRIKKLEAKVKIKSKRKLVINDSEEEEAAKDYAELEKLISLAETAVNEPSSFVTPSKTTAADSSQNEDISPSTAKAAQILTGGKLDPSKISKSPAAVAQRSMQTFVRKRSSKSTQGLDYSDVDFSPRDSVATDSSILAEEVVPADKGVCVASSNKGKGIADESSPLPSIKRQRDLDDMIASFSNTEWMILMARVKDFPEVAKEILGADVNDDNFSSRLQALVDKRKSAMSIQRYRAQQAKPMTRGDTVKFMRTYIKNMSVAYYYSGRTMEWANKYKSDDLIAEHNKIKSAVEHSTTSQDEPAEESSFLGRSTRKKSVAKKRTTPPSSSIPFSTDDPDAAHTTLIRLYGFVDALSKKQPLDGLALSL
nr:hypothetical protein [Tanacetum cinerariifolium]